MAAHCPHGLSAFEHFQTGEAVCSPFGGTHYDLREYGDDTIEVCRPFFMPAPPSIVYAPLRRQHAPLKSHAGGRAAIDQPVIQPGTEVVFTPQLYSVIISPSMTSSSSFPPSERLCRPLFMPKQCRCDRGRPSRLGRKTSPFLIRVLSSIASGDRSQPHVWK